MQIIGITGLPSSGKGEFSRIARTYDFYEVIMGDVIREELRNRGLEVNRENSNALMVELRKERGENIVAELTLEKINTAIKEGKKRILIDGIRSLHEVTFFRSYFQNLKIIAIHADPQTRFERSKLRKRKDDAFSIESFNERDKIELEVGIGNVIALADIMVNSPQTLEEAEVQYAKLIESFLDVNNTPLVY